MWIRETPGIQPGVLRLSATHTNGRDIFGVDVVSLWSRYAANALFHRYGNGCVILFGAHEAFPDDEAYSIDKSLRHVGLQNVSEDAPVIGLFKAGQVNQQPRCIVKCKQLLAILLRDGGIKLGILRHPCKQIIIQGGIEFAQVVRYHVVIAKNNSKTTAFI